MTSAFGPQVCGTLDEAAAREWLVADGARRLRDGHGRRAAHPPLPRAARGRRRRAGAAGCSASPRSTRCSSSATRASGSRPTSGPAATVDPRGHELLASFDLERRRAALALAGRRRRRSSASSRWRTARPAVGVVHRLLARRPAGAARADAALHLAERARRAVRERRPRGRGDGRRLRVRGRLPRRRRRAASPGGEWYRGVRAREEAARGLNDREDLWAAGTFAAELEPGDVPRGDGRGRAVRRRRCPPRPRSSPTRADARDEAASARPAPTDEVDAQLVLAADQFAITTAGRPTAVAGYPWFGEWSRDLMTSYEGLYLATEPLDEGREVLRTVGRDRVRGDAREHRRHGHARVQHGRRHALVRPRRSAATSPSPATTTSAAELGAGARRDRRSTTSTARASASASTRPTGCCGRARTAGR